MKKCGNCKWWGRNEPRPVNFAPCRYPLPEAVLEFIANGSDENGVPAFLKISDGGTSCDVWESSLEEEHRARCEQEVFAIVHGDKS